MERFRPTEYLLTWNLSNTLKTAWLCSFGVVLLLQMFMWFVPSPCENVCEWGNSSPSNIQCRLQQNVVVILSEIMMVPYKCSTVHLSDNLWFRLTSTKKVTFAMQKSTDENLRELVNKCFFYFSIKQHGSFSFKSEEIT